MADYESRIKVIIETMIEGYDKVPGFRKALNNLGVEVNNAGKAVSATNKQFITTANLMPRLQSNLDTFGGALFMDKEIFKQVTTSGMKFNTVGGKMGAWLRNLTTGIRGFQMGLLGIMFFSQAASQALFGLLQPAAQLVGVFDLWTLTLQMLFLPIILALLPLFLQLVDWLMNLPEGVKMAIGVFVILAAVFFKIIAFVASLLLGIGGLITTLGSLGITGTAVGGAVSGAVSAIGAAFWPVTAIILAVIALWASNIGGFRDFVKNQFGIMSTTIMTQWTHLIGFVKSIFDFFINILKGDWDAAGESFVNIFRHLIASIIKFIIGFGMYFVNAFVFAINLVKDLFFNVLLGGIIYVVKKIYELLNKVFGDNAPEWMKNATSVAQNMQDNIKAWSSFLTVSYLKTEDLKDTYAAIDNMLGLKAPEEHTKSIAENTTKAEQKVEQNTGLMSNDFAQAMASMSQSSAEGMGSIAANTESGMSFSAETMQSALGQMQTSNSTSWANIVTDTASYVDQYNAEVARMARATTVSGATTGGGGGGGSSSISAATNAATAAATAASSAAQSSYQAVTVLRDFGAGYGEYVTGGQGYSGRIPTNYFGDFMWRAGQAPVRFSPADTITGSTGGAGGMVFSPTYNIYVSDKVEMKRMIDDNNSKMVVDLQRMIRA
jgi:hypothetical protein